MELRQLPLKLNRYKKRLVRTEEERKHNYIQDNYSS